MPPIKSTSEAATWSGNLSETADTAPNVSLDFADVALPAADGDDPVFDDRQPLETHELTRRLRTALAEPERATIGDFARVVQDIAAELSFFRSLDAAAQHLAAGQAPDSTATARDSALDDGEIQVLGGLLNSLRR